MFSFTSHMVIVVLWFLFASTISSLMGQESLNHARCSEKDQYALSMFRQGIEDPSKWLSSWSTEEDCCKWAGVECDNITGRVTELDLGCSKFNFSAGCFGGVINFSSLFELEFLSYLSLGFNDFKAIYFPPIYGYANDRKSHNSSLEKTSYSSKNSSSLLDLDLSYNPSLHMDNLRWVSRFPALKYLDLNGITIHESLWLQQLNVLPSLVELSLRDCALTGIGINPSLQFVNFTSLAYLDISNNYLDPQMPKWLFNLNGSLSNVDLSSNNLQGQIPAAVMHFQHLEALRLGSNNLNGSIPEWMGQHKNLDHLDLSNNSFSGPIPATFGNLSSLTFLDVSNNHLNGSLPMDLGKLSKLEYLSVGYNSLSGNLSEQNFIQLSSLELLMLEASAFIFQFGTDWQPPFQLTELRIPNSKLGPEFPSWLYSQTSLRFLDISSSGLSFFATSEFWFFVGQMIPSVNLYNNSISGEISGSLIIANTAINLKANNLTGKLPRLFPEVYFFNAADNNLSGPISPSLCNNMPREFKLMHLDLSNNLFSGEFPECWALFKSLRHLSLGGNKLTGRIPDSIGSLKKLQTLRLHNNNLSGNLPASLESFSQLWFLDLGFNEFTGNIPSWISKLSMILLLRSNKFNGSIPSQICQLPNLALLDLANNRFSGPIPKCLHNIAKTGINTINDDLSEPYFNEEYASYLPETYTEDLNLLVKGHQLAYKKNILLLRIVDLSGNDLSGLIPPELFGVSVYSL